MKSRQERDRDDDDPQKLTTIEALTPEKRILFQREQRTEQKALFRKKMESVLGEEFKILAEGLKKYGIEMFRDFVNPEKFQQFINAYDHKMDEASKSALKYYFKGDLPEHSTNE